MYRFVSSLVGLLASAACAVPLPMFASSVAEAGCRDVPARAHMCNGSHVEAHTRRVRDDGDASRTTSSSVRSAPAASGYVGPAVSSPTGGNAYVPSAAIDDGDVSRSGGGITVGPGARRGRRSLYDASC